MTRLVGFEVGQSGLQPLNDSGTPLAVGVWGDSDTGMGVFGTSGVLPAGITAPGGQPAGVVGDSVQNPGVVGRSVDNYGVIGQSRNGDGVLGVSSSPTSNGIVASNVGGGDGVFSLVGDGNAVNGNSLRTGTGVFGGNFRGFNPSDPPATGTGVSGYNQDVGIGVSGVSPAGVGVSGRSDTGTGVVGVSPSGEGVLGSSTTGIGVVGINQDKGTGIVGFSSSGDGVYGNSNTGSGVSGASNTRTGVSGVSTTGIGVGGSSPSGDGVAGSSDTGVGVRGFSETSTAMSALSISGDGLVSFTGGYGTGVAAYSALGYGVEAYSYGSADPRDPKNPVAAGVIAASNQAPGIVAHSTQGSGVIGSGGIYAGEFLGNVLITGVLIGGKLNRMDHPTDPANKYLTYASVSSPEAKNVYDGVAELDVNGAALVELPGWFETLNESFRYQLTPIGGPAPELYVAEEVRENQFKIAGGEPQMKVSWQVTGKQQDRWMAAGRCEVEKEKIHEEKGCYLQPELFGESEELRIGGNPRRKEQVREIQRRLKQQSLPPKPLIMDLDQRQRVEELTLRIVEREAPLEQPTVDLAGLEEQRRGVEELVASQMKSSNSAPRA